MVKSRQAASMLASLALLAWPLALPAQSPVSVHTDPGEIPIDVGFDGHDLTVFGIVPAGSDGVIAICQSSQTPPVTLARKERVGIFWMATKRFSIENLPGLYLLASTAPLAALLGERREAVCLQHGIGYASLKEAWQVERVSGEEAADDMKVLFAGLIQVKESEGLYGAREGVIRYESQGLFFHKFRIPDAVTVGSQLVNVYAVKDQEVIASGSAEFQLHRAGVIDWLFNLAWEHAVLYGVVAVLVAAGAGLTASKIFGGRGGH